MASSPLSDLQFWISYLSALGPYAVVAGVGLIVALLRWGRHPVVSMLAAAGLGLTLFNLLLGLGLTVWQLNRMQPSDAAWLMNVAATIRGLLGAVALALVVLAVFVGRRDDAVGDFPAARGAE